MTEITDHLAEIRERVATALARSGRGGDDVLILAVSKGHAAAAIRAAADAGQRDFGESYVGEALPKMDELADLDLRWHFIGRIQANKTRAIAERFDYVHTLDREKIARRLDSRRPAAAAPLKALIQVDQAGEPQKGGVPEADVAELARTVLALPRLELAGLMSLPPLSKEPTATAAYFRRLHALRSELAATGVAAPMLSMGMSADFELALAEGSGCIRIGTAIFGPRAG